MGTKRLSNGVLVRFKALITNKELIEKISKGIKKLKVYTWEEIAERHLSNLKKLVH